MAYATASALPPALLDLTLLRVAAASSARLSSSGSVLQWQRAPGWRRMHQAAAFNPPTPPNVEELMDSRVSRKGRSSLNKGFLTVKSANANASQVPMHPVEELERRVQALDEALESEALAFRPIFYTEEDLLAMYQDVMAVPIPHTTQDNKQAALQAIQRAEEKEDRRILDLLQQRLVDDIPLKEGCESHQKEPTHRRILAEAHEIFFHVEAARKKVNPESSKHVPLGLLSIREFEALVRESLKAKDVQAAEVALDMMKKECLPLPPAAITKFLNLYATGGNIKAADDLLANFLTETPTEFQRHLHVKAHLNGTPNDLIPTSALDLLHHYEGQNAAAPMQTYTSVITALFSRPSSLARAQAWDIFTHMRYVAHPEPDVVLYTLMIRACAFPVSIRYSSEPEKALDLWTEMTVDNKITPTVGAYNAVILACARSGTKTYVNEAFRLARQMLDSHRDASGLSAFRPDRKTFCALLEGAKRTGNLARARWILAEMVRGSRDNDPNPLEAEIDDEVMMHILNAYAAYKPPFVRAATVLVDSDSGSEVAEKSAQKKEAHQEASNPTVAVQASPESSSTADSSSETSLVVEDEDEYPSFAHIPPQSRAEVIREVKILFNRILQDRSGTKPTATASLPFAQQKFSGVEITSRLVGAYLSVFYKHASLDTSRDLFWKLSEDFNVTKTPKVYLEALERCANARRGHERQIAVPFADQLWERWTALEDSGRRTGKPLPSRLVERAHIAMIRLLAVTENIDRSMAQLRAFAAKYPPNAVRTPAPKPAFRSTRTSLVGQRPLVRMTSAAEVPDDYVPPLVTFRDVEILHHRLIDYERTKDIGYVTWVCKAYEWALRVRRDETVKTGIAKNQTEMRVVA
ncbi:hypothetical protein BDZ97DRAFT_1790526 [Flammula alnicola]|nr:hypothetical protein BDZ97DRAFT_1790526 [Flammula alnicola]